MLLACYLLTVAWLNWILAWQQGALAGVTATAPLAAEWLSWLGCEKTAQRERNTWRESTCLFTWAGCKCRRMEVTQSAGHAAFAVEVAVDCNNRAHNAQLTIE